MSSENLNALILTGGQGTRLRPLTLYTLKPLLPIVNIPFLSYLLAHLRRHLVFKSILCTSDSFQPYRNLVARERTLGSALLCSREREPLGTAGALKNAERLIESFPVFIFNGDVLTDINLSQMLAFHRAQKAKITVALMPVPDPSSYGLIRVDAFGRIKSFQEKPAHLKVNQKKTYLINAGIYLFEKEIFDLILAGRNVSTEKELFPKCLNMNLPIYGYRARASNYWLDIGTPQKYLKANVDGSLKKFSGSMNHLSKVGDKTKINATASIGAGVVIGNHCAIEAGAALKNCVLLDHVKIEKQAAVENCIIGSHAKIGHHAKVIQSRMIGDYSTITPYSQI